MKSGSSVRPILVASFIVVFALCNVVLSGQLTTTINFSEPRVETVNGMHRIILQDAMNLGEPGSPSMPSVGIWMALPPGNQAETAHLDNVVWKSLTGKYTIEPALFPQRLKLQSRQASVQPPQHQVWLSAPEFQYLWLR